MKEYLENIISNISSNKKEYLIVIIALAVFYYLSFKHTNQISKFIKHPIVKFLIIFALVYMVKRDIGFAFICAITATIIFYFIETYNEKITPIIQPINNEEIIDEQICSVPEEGRGCGCVPLTLPEGSSCCSTCTQLPVDTGGSIIEIGEDESIVPFNKFGQFENNI